MSDSKVDIRYKSLSSSGFESDSKNPIDIEVSIKFNESIKMAHTFIYLGYFDIEHEDKFHLFGLTEDGQENAGIVYFRSDDATFIRRNFSVKIVQYDLHSAMRNRDNFIQLVGANIPENGFSPPEEPQMYLSPSMQLKCIVFYQGADQNWHMLRAQSEAFIYYLPPPRIVNVSPRSIALTRSENIVSIELDRPFYNGYDQSCQLSACLRGNRHSQVNDPLYFDLRRCIMSPVLQLDFGYRLTWQAVNAPPSMVQVCLSGATAGKVWSRRRSFKLRTPEGPVGERQQFEQLSKDARRKRHWVDDEI